MINRQEHTKWCKERARAYLDIKSIHYSVSSAFASMVSDMRKHSETNKQIESPPIQLVMMATMMKMNHIDVQNFIEGFP